MKKYLVLLLFFPIFVLAQFDSKYEAYKHIKIDKAIKKYTDQLRYFYHHHGIDIDYRPIREIRFQGDMFDQNGEPLAGYWGEDHVLRVRVTHPLGVDYGIYDKIVLITLAHELAHSQGYIHDTTSILMNPRNSVMYNTLILEKKTLTELLLEPYIQETSIGDSIYIPNIKIIQN